LGDEDPILAEEVAIFELTMKQFVAVFVIDVSL
jgi:hypothetical protein